MGQRATLLIQSIEDWPIHRKLMLVGVVALLLRLPVLIIILLHPERAILASDARQYLQLADNLRLHGVFSREAMPPFTPDTYRTPGYPLLIFPLTLLFGSSPLRALVFVQVIIGALTACGVFLLARRVFDERAGLLSGLMYALLPMPIIMAGYAYSETLFAMCLVGGSLLLLAGLDQDRWPLTLAAGLVFGLAVLVRPIAIWLLPVLVLFVVVRQSLHRGWLPALILTLSFMLLPAGWMTRNLVLFDHFALSSIGDNNLFYYNVASTEARRLGISVNRSRPMLEELREALPDDPSNWPYSAEGQIAREVILAHPVAFVAFNGLDALNGFRPGFSFMLFLVSDDPAALTVNIFQFGDLREVLYTMRGQAVVPLVLEAYMTLTLLATVVGMLVGIVLLIRERRWADLLLLAGIPAVLLYLPGLASNARFRAPTEVFLGMLLAWAFSEILSLRTQGQRSNE